jgi:putative tryptophan/tyrosine transport system substrate-binding protein
MDRRRFLLTALVGVLAVPVVGEARQTGKVYRIGVLGNPTAATPFGHRIYEAFRQGLRDHGFVEGPNITIEWRYSEGQEDRHVAFVAEFIQMNLDVIATHSSAAVAAAKHATSTIPIVMLGVASPERQGLVASLARPGGNVTGMSNQHAGEFSGKTLQVLKDALPHISTLAILWNPDNLGSAMSFREGEVPAAQALGLTLLSLEVRGPGDLDRALATVAAERPDALLVHSVAVQFHAGLLDFAAKHRLPTVGTVPLWPRLGGLMSFGPDLADLHRRAATHVAKILRGVKPADLPVEQPTQFELIINLKAAKALGLTIPPSLLLRADQVIDQ